MGVSIEEYRRRIGGINCHQTSGIFKCGNTCCKVSGSPGFVSDDLGFCRQFIILLLQVSCSSFLSILKCPCAVAGKLLTKTQSVIPYYLLSLLSLQLSDLDCDVTLMTTVCLGTVLWSGRNVLNGKLIMKLIPSSVLYILLLISGIEPNPGPDYVCKECNKEIASLNLCWGHLKIHESVGKPLYCPISNCSRVYSTVRSAQTHISRDHKTAKGLPDLVDFKCPIIACGLHITTRSSYLSHMAGHLLEGASFKCCYDSCDHQMKSLGVFRSHVSSRHPKAERPLIEYEVSSDPSDSSDDAVEQASVSGKGSTKGKLKGCFRPEVDNSEEDAFPEYAAKEQLAKFYLCLESEFLLPTSTVQKVAEEITHVTEMSHHFLKKALKPLLEEAGLDKKEAEHILLKTFNSDPVFNVHHKNKDAEQLGTDHLRQKFWRNHFPYVQPKEVNLGIDEFGRKKLAHYVSIRESIKVMLRDPKIKEMVLQSLQKRPGETQIYSDYTDGSAYTKHMEEHHGGNCITLNLFQDGFDFNAFGPTQGAFKPVGFYFTLNNIKPQFRMKVSLIQLAYMILEKHMKNNQEEEIEDVDKLKEVLQPLLNELEDLKNNGICIDGKMIPVCLLFSQGDNLGQHVIGGFVQSFSCQHCCRFCPISLEEFREMPYLLPPLRTQQQYDDCVRLAKKEWKALRTRSIDYATKAKARRREAEQLERLHRRGHSTVTRNRMQQLLSKSAFQKLCGVHVQGVKYRPSPLNSKTLKFHVSAPSLPPCIAHDLFEGVVKNMLPKILQHFIEAKDWFDLKTLNRRIKGFEYKGPDKNDAPTPLKSLTALSGNASENWTLLRLLPFLIGDLIQDPDDVFWKLYLSLKVVVEYSCAPKISLRQILYMKTLISEYLLDVKKILPQCLYPKQHLIMHYPGLTLIFGPLIKLFTLRFESKHVFFKSVGKACKNFINITYTLARKYALRFAYDHANNIIPSEVEYPASTPITHISMTEDRRSAIPEQHFSAKTKVLTEVTVNGVHYKPGYYMILDSFDACDLVVGLIDIIFMDPPGNVFFLMDEKIAVNSFKGYYIIKMPASKLQCSALETLPDCYPLPSYNFNGCACLSLKHVMIKM